MKLISTFEALVREVSFVMTRPTFQMFLVVLTGWLFARRRTVTGMILAAGAVGVKHHSAFHRLFASVRWSLDALGLAAFDLVMRLVDPAATVFLAVDNTLARKRGRKIFGVGMHHDPLLSSRGCAVVNWGHNWVVLGVLVEVPILKGRWVCLPVLLRLYRSRQTIAQRGGRYRTRPQLAVEMLQRLCLRHTERRFHLTGDSTDSGKSVVRPLPDDRPAADGCGPVRPAAEAPRPWPSMQEGSAVADARGDAPRQDARGGVGHLRPARAGADGHGRGARVRVGGSPAGAGGDRRAALHRPQAAGVLLDCDRRQPRAGHDLVRPAVGRGGDVPGGQGAPGVRGAQGWTRRAVERTAPTAMLLYTLIVVWFVEEGHQHLSFPERPWFPGKHRASFADMLRTLRLQSLRERFWEPPVWDRGSRKTIQALLALCARAA